MSVEIRVKGDGKHRYDTVKKLTSDIDPQKQILDIGGYPHQDSNLLTMNISPSHTGTTPELWGNGINQPFADNSFPAVISTDVLGSISSGTGDDDQTFNARLAFMSESLRVAGQKVVVTTPFFSRGNVRAEQDLIEELRKLKLPKRNSLIKRQELGLPSLDELVQIGRRLRQPFEIHPATHRSTLFQSLSDQAQLIPLMDKRRTDVQQTLEHLQEKTADRLNSSTPSWEDAYRAVMVIDKNKPGRVVTDESEVFLGNSEIMTYQAALRKAGFTSIPDNEVFQFYKSLPLRGRNIAIEGPEGSGKTSLVKALKKRFAEWGYTTVTQTDFGIRQWMRDMEKAVKMVISDPERAEFFLFAMWQAAIGSNAFTLQGPNYVNISDRTIASVQMHHALHCPQNRSIPYTLEQRNPLSIPPDLTIVMWVPDPNLNFQLMQKDGDLVNSTKGPDHLNFQRDWYTKLCQTGGNRYTGPIYKINNPGREGSFEDIISEALGAIENITGIPTTH